MKKMNWKRKLAAVVGASLLLMHQGTYAATQEAEAGKPITLRTMGSLFFGGTVTRRENGETFHGDHGYAQFYVPQNARTYPIIMWHSLGQSGRSFESTPDGREGYQAILSRDDWPVYIIDQPRRGRAGRTQSKPSEGGVPTITRESGVWNAFRMGRWVPPHKAQVFGGVQTPYDGYTIDQFMRQQTGDTGELPRTPEYRKFLGNTMKALLEQAGPSILLTHSNSGGFGWASGMAAPQLVKAIVTYEPGQHAMPVEETVERTPSTLPEVEEVMDFHRVPLEEFKKLTKMPILLIYGDNIAEKPSTVFNEEVWRISYAHAKQFVDAINRHGGYATLIHLPDLGIKGNTHAAFADLNNLQIADMMEDWLKKKGLAGREKPYQGPARPEMEVSIPLDDKPVG